MENEWIVMGENNNRINLVSTSNVTGLLPKGSFLTIEEEGNKFVLRVDDSNQTEPYSPTPLTADMDIEALEQDRKCQNIISAYRIKNITNREDGLIDHIKPNWSARRSTQSEVDDAIGNETEGAEVLLASVYAGDNQLLLDSERNPLTAKIPEETFYHQTMICGKTGAGKTNASKYLARYFVNELNGAVLALNVKQDDFLHMDKSSNAPNSQVEKEWEALGINPDGLGNQVEMYFPANKDSIEYPGVDRDKTTPVTLRLEDLSPSALTGLLEGTTELAERQLPNIFRYWKEEETRGENLTFTEFSRYFREHHENKLFKTKNSQGDLSETSVSWGTFQNINRSLDSAAEFFDNDNAESLDEEDILEHGKMSIIDVSGRGNKRFGATLLRDLLDRIVEAKKMGEYNLPILIIIDEVHTFYDDESSKEALRDLADICRTGRSNEIGIIFSSQNPSDIPGGLSTVINSKIFFKTDAKDARKHGVSVDREEMENLDTGYAVSSIHGLPQVKLLKFPLSPSGMTEE